jgi:predicted ATPase
VVRVAEDERQGIRDGAPGQPRSSQGDFAVFVRDALAHLYDPAYLQTHPLTHYVETDSGTRRPVLGRLLRQALLEAIEALHPGQGIEGTSDRARHSRILQLRYVEGLSAQEVQAKLAISRTHYYREQAAAVEAVVSILAARWRVGETQVSGIASQRRDAPQSPVEPRHNLPAQLTSFVGREREMAEVRRLLGQTRFLTLTGTGGCGKTRLALQVAADVLDAYPDGVWLVEFAPLAETLLVPQTVAVVLGVREQPGLPTQDVLATHLKPKRCLLVLDNCEHLLDACAALADSLLRACPRLAILASSRESLGITGETSYRVPSLAAPAPDHLTSAEDVARYEAVQLFADRAAAVRPGFQVTEQNAPAVALVCWRLDGIPLALELAAARLRGLSIEQLARHMDDRFRLLTGGSRTALRRQQTLRAAIDWSYDLLDEPNRALFRRLSVFAGGWTLDAAEAVGAGGEVERDGVLDLLMSLVDKSLVIAEEAGGAERYGMLETIRQYAGERLLDSGEMKSVRTSHRDYYLAVAEGRGEIKAWEKDMHAWLEEVELEHDNLRAALDWCQILDDREAELRLAGEMGWFWRIRGYVVEGRVRLARTLERTVGLNPETRLEALNWAARMEYMSGDTRRARELTAEGVRVAEEQGDLSLVLEARLFYAFLEFVVGDTWAAIDLLEETLPMASQMRLTDVANVAAVYLGAMLYRLGETKRARQFLDYPSESARREGTASAGALVWQSAIAVSDGNYDEAQRLTDELLAYARSSGYKNATAHGLFRLGDLARARGDPGRARQPYVDGLKLMRDASELPMVAVALLRLAGLGVDAGRPEWSARLMGTVASWYGARSIRIQHDEHPSRERDLARARELLGEEAFSRAFTEGQAMTLEQAVEYALQDEG